MSDAGPPVKPESAPATCPECGRSAADYLTMGEVYELHGYARSKCMRCLVSDVPRMKAEDRRPGTDATSWTPAELLSTTNSFAWADAFCRIVGKDAPAFCDKRLHIAAWFANAIKAGEIAADRDRVRREIATPDAG